MADRKGKSGNSDRNFIFWGFKITTDGDCRYEIKRHLLLGRKTMRNLGRVFKSRDIILLTKAHIVKAVVFPVVTCKYASWTIKKAECWRIDAFKFLCLENSIPWTARRSNQLIIKEISPEYSFIGRTDAEDLATWCKESTRWNRPQCWERLKAGGEGDDRGWDNWMASLTRWTWIWASSGRWWRTGKPGVL